MPIIQNGQGLEIAVPPGQSIAVASLTGTYSATLLDGAGRGVLASASAGGATYGPYPAGATLRVKAGVDSCVAYDVGVSPSAVANPVATFETNASGDVLWLRAPDGRHIEVEGTTDQEAAQFRAAGGVVAAFYYGEWRTPGTSYNLNPWDCMQPYADRLPVISQKISAGVYGLPADNAAAVEWEQRQAMAAGVDVFVHNAYWIKDPAGAEPANICHASLEAHADCPAGMRFALQWSNHETWITTMAEFNAAIDYMMGWAKNYPAKYWHINGLPVFYIWSMDSLKTVAQAVFAEPDWIVALEKAVTQIKARAVALGLPGVFVTSCAGFDHPLWTGRAFGFVGVNERIGCGAQTVYNRHSAYTERTQNAWGGDAVWATKYPQNLNNFDQLTEIYRIAEDWIINGSGSQLPVFASAICGWDRRPWLEKEGQTAQQEDNCTASPEQWLEHLRQQRAFAMAGTRSKPGVPPVVNAYAWNEYGEGAFLCPSRRYGWQMLDQIKRAMGVTA